MKRGKRASLFVCAGLVWFCCFSLAVQAEDKKPYAVIETAALKNLIDSQAAVTVVDTRNPEEYADEHIPGAVNIPQKSFDTYAHLLPADKDSQVVFYCNGFK